MKISSFCAAFIYSNGTDRAQGKFNYRFRSNVKDNGKEGLELSKVRM